MESIRDKIEPTPRNHSFFRS